MSYIFSSVSTSVEYPVLFFFDDGSPSFSNNIVPNCWVEFILNSSPASVYISCVKDNIPSRQIILNHGGIFEKEFYDDFEGKGEKYWIKLNPPVKNLVRRYSKIKKEY